MLIKLYMSLQVTLGGAPPTGCITAGQATISFFLTGRTNAQKPAALLWLCWWQSRLPQVTLTAVYRDDRPMVLREAGEPGGVLGRRAVERRFVHLCLLHRG